MKHTYLVIIMASFLSSFNVHAVPDSDASVIFLRKNCDTLNNCYTSFNQLLDWVWEVRKPKKSSPLLIDAGPGEFPVQANTLYCDGELTERGHVTLRGSGRDNTTFYSPTSQTLGAVIQINKCNKLSFQDLSIRGAVGEAEWGINWNGGGDSSWVNVSVETPGFPWYDSLNGGQCLPEEAGKHYWFSSTIRVKQEPATFSYPSIGLPAYYSICGDAWFYGSEISNISEKTKPRSGIRMQGSGAMAHIYGTSVKVESPAVSFKPLVGLEAISGGVIHFHGGEVSVRGEGASNQSVTGAIAIDDNSIVHAYEISWGLAPTGTGTATRLKILNNGIIKSVFDWGARISEPSITSINGADKYIETDCDATGNCDNVPDEQQRPHPMLYTNKCINSGFPWFDVATNKCKGE